MDTWHVLTVVALVLGGLAFLKANDGCDILG